MAVPSSGQLSMLAIWNELDDNDYNAGSGEDNVGMQKLHDGTIDTINQINLSTDRPDGSVPHAMSEFYAYDNDATIEGLLADDFYTTGTDTAKDTRISYVVSEPQTEFASDVLAMTDDEPSTFTTRPVWTFSSSTGTSHESNDRIRMTNNNDSTYNAQWRMDSGPTFMTITDLKGTLTAFDMSVEFSFYMSSTQNKDLIFFWETSDGQGDGWGVSGGLDSGFHWQFMDDTTAVRIRRRNAYNTITTLGTSSSGVFNKGEWVTAKCRWQKDDVARTGSETIYINGTSVLTTTDTQFSPAMYGMRFVSSKFMATGQYNDIDWIRMWRDTGNAPT